MAKQTKDTLYMQRCFELARKGAGKVSPNPMVGCVIVRDGTIIAEGYHARFGGAHAEVNALKAAGKKARGATLYVNLEPCAHHGKTPPCAYAIIAAGVKAVVAASKDPNPFVAGAGFQKLRRAGIKVKVGVLQQRAEYLNEKFFTFMKTGLPFVGIKIAQTLDGKIADARGVSKWITNDQARKHSHRLRAEYDAILVGATTVLRDDPQLTVRAVKGRNPLRVVVDGRLTVAANARLFKTRVARTIVLTSSRAMRERHSKVQKFSRQGVEVIPVQNNFSLSPKTILKTLARLNVSSVLIEGGSRTVGAFLESKLVHKIHCFIAPKILGEGLSGLTLTNSRPLSKAIQIKEPSIQRIGSDILIEGRIQQS